MLFQKYDLGQALWYIRVKVLPVTQAFLNGHQFETWLHHIQLSSLLKFLGKHQKMAHVLGSLKLDGRQTRKKAQALLTLV